MKKTVVVGIGHRHRRDDGVGPAVLDRLRGKLPAEVDALDLGSDPLALFEVFDAATSVVLVDAVEGSGPPGTVSTFAGEEVVAKSRHLRGVTSSHGIDVAASLALAARLGRLPDCLRVVAIEVADVGRGDGLSPPVRAALPEAERAVLEALAR